MNAAPLPVRIASDADTAGIVELVNSAYRGDSSRAGWTTEADLLGGQRTDAARVAAIVNRAHGVILLHERDGVLLSCVHLERRGADCYLGMLTVSPSEQGRGLGRRMIDAAERWAAAEWGSQSMQMTVIAQRPELIAWYERRGYRKTGERRPFPYGDVRAGLPLRDDLVFDVLEKALPSSTAGFPVASPC